MLPPNSLPTPPQPGRERHRDSVRASLLRANTAVAAIIGIVLVLALGALWQSGRATRLQATAREQQRRAETAELGARAELRRALQAEARATRLGQTLDRRSGTLDALRRAAAIEATPELRNEAVATLALPERIMEASLALDASIRTHEFDPTLTSCALGLTDGDVVIRRLADGAEIQRLRPGPDTVPPDQGRPTGLSFSPDGRLLSVRYLRGALAVWELESGRLRFVHDADQLRHQASRGLFSSDGGFLVAPVFNPDGFAVLETATGRVVSHFPEIGSYNHAAVRPGARQFAGYDGTKVLVFDWETRERLLEAPFEFGVYHLNWSPDGCWLGIFGNSLELHLWNLTTGQRRVLQGHQDAVYQVYFDPAGELLAGMSFDGVSRIWNLQDGRVAGVSTDRRMLHWGADGRIGWLLPRESLEVWRDQPSPGYARAAVPPVAAETPQLDVSPDGAWAVGVTAAQDGLLVWPLRPPGPPAVFPLPKVESAVFDPHTGQLLVIRDQGLETFDWTAEPEGGVPRFRLGVSVASMPVPDRQVNRVVCAADGRTRAFVNLKGGAVWVQHPGALGALVSLEKQVLHSAVAYQGGSPLGAGVVALSPDGRWLVCGADGWGVRVVDTRTGQPVAALNTPAGGVQFSPDGRWLVLNGPPECVLFRTSDWAEVWRKKLAAYIYQPFGSVAIAPDGSQVAFVQSPTQVALVSAASGRELAVLESPSGSPPATLRWSPAGDQLVALTREHSLDVWRLGALRRELAGLGLDWDAPASSPAPAPPPPVASASAQGIALGILLTAGVVAAVALLALRRHRQLIEDFSRTEALASRRERELEIEREVGRLKSSFVSMVSHEFRTPLGITMSAVELLQNYSDRLPPAKRTELLGDIHGSTRHMSDLMEQVLLLGRVEAGKLGFKPARLDLAALVERLADETVSATHRRCPVRWRVEGDLAGAVGDESLMRHILGNLVANGVKYSPAGTPVEFTVRREGEAAVFTVRDQGIGIPEADLPQLFQAFHRAGNVGEIPGTGLGLVIVKRCVDLHGGGVSVQSRPGAGTEFTVRLPVFAAS